MKRSKDFLLSTDYCLLITVVLCFLFLVGCAQVNVYVTFPAEKIEEAALEIEKEVEGEEAPTPESKDPKKESLIFFSSVAFAGERQTVSFQIKVQTPEIKSAIASRKKRNPEVNKYKKEGVIGENNRGLLEERPTPKLLTDKSYAKKVRKIIKEENRDRLIIFKTIVEQNNMNPEQMVEVKKAFAGARRTYARSGEWIQLEDGKWVQK